MRELMAFLLAAFRPPTTPEPVKSDVTRRLAEQRRRLEHLRTASVRAGYRAAGERFVERRKVPR